MLFSLRLQSGRVGCFSDDYAKFASVLTIYGAPRAWEKPRDSHFLPNTVITMGVGSYFYCLGAVI